jgi:hypothetical protein
MIFPPEHIEKLAAGLRKRHPRMRISLRETHPPTHPKHGVQIIVGGKSIIRVGKYGRTKSEGDFDSKKAITSKTCLGITREHLRRECREIMRPLRGRGRRGASRR